MGSGSGSKQGLQQGPFEFGPSQYDTQAINSAITGAMDPEIAARYAQLGLPSSSAQSTDVANANLMGQAAQGQLQTSEITNPAFNPALQPATTNQQGTVLGSGIGAAVQGAANLLKPS